MFLKKCITIYPFTLIYFRHSTGSCSTFEFTSWVNLSGPNRTSWCNKVDAVRLYASYRLNLRLPKGQRCVTGQMSGTVSFTKCCVNLRKLRSLVDKDVPTVFLPSSLVCATISRLGGPSPILFTLITRSW